MPANDHFLTILFPLLLLALRVAFRSEKRMTLPSRFQKEVHAHLSRNPQQVGGKSGKLTGIALCNITNNQLHLHFMVAQLLGLNTAKIFSQVTGSFPDLLKPDSFSNPVKCGQWRMTTSCCIPSFSTALGSFAVHLEFSNLFTGNFPNSGRNNYLILSLLWLYVSVALQHQ